MYYRNRSAEPRLELLTRYFKVVLVTGARQVGKSTLLNHVYPQLKTVVFDPVQDIFGAREDPDLFLDSFPPPLILDEIQLVPELLGSIKRRVDQSHEPGQYLLTGSQNLSVLREVSDSMAGRVGILQLEGMTPAEMLGQGAGPVWLSSYLDDPSSLVQHVSGTWSEVRPITRHLWRGSMPGLLDLPDEIVPDFYRSYVQTYVERDVRQAADIQELASFARFIGVSAALTSAEINASQLGRDVGVAPATARKWLDILTYTYQWRELSPYHGNTIKRLSGKRKGLMCDSGLVCHLQRISSPEALAASPLLGAIFETWAVNNIHRQFIKLDVQPNAYHWRTAGGAEVDLVLERDGKLYPIEVKCTTKLRRRDTSGLRAFRETYGQDQVQPGLVIYAGNECYRLDEHTTAVPWNAIAATSSFTRPN